MPDAAANGIVLCLDCGQHVRIVTAGDDPRWRYAEHNRPATGERCEGSNELVDEGAKS